MPTVPPGALPPERDTAMKPNPKTPGERDLSLINGIVLMLLSGIVLAIWHLTGGDPARFPAMLGWGFLICGSLIVLSALRRRRTRRR